ncbi:hypothetical protein VNI00_010748 [Paramarasmius palmivorus]|uniref:AMP-dependent synthetase/ligase domain-containing protein n=1 Tax=Paramarasmius palmivorus TaxID=297713 RepID=A0AAW0CFG9_9AGAR
MWTRTLCLNGRWSEGLASSFPKHTAHVPTFRYSGDIGYGAYIYIWVEYCLSHPASSTQFNLLKHRTHLTVLEEASRKHPSAIAFKIPSSDPQECPSITYSQWALDVDRLAQYWYHTLSKGGIDQGSVVAMCLGGHEYIDVIQVYAVLKAGYVPHTFSRLPGISVIQELLYKSNTQALIRSVDFKEVLETIQGLPIFDAAKLADAEESTMGPIPAMPEKQAQDTLHIAHTSGSTSGTPKLVYLTYGWMDGTVTKQEIIVHPGKRGPEVVNWMGNICHMAQFIGLVARALDGDCTILLRKPGDLDELIELVKRNILDVLFAFTPSLVKILNASQFDVDLRDSLARLNRVRTGGAPLPRSAEEYATKNGINVVNVFGSTEVGTMLLSKGTRYDPANTLHVHNIPGTLYRFVEIARPDAEIGHSNARLLELVILSDSTDCPAPSFRSPDDGHFHTGDLWEQAKDGGYIYRGRDDDWINCENACLCDASAIEDIVRTTCTDLIFDCVVVGSGRPSPALFVEPKNDSVEHEKLRGEIFTRILPFNERLMVHERIASVRMVIIVQKHALPRTATKGNIRRKVVEGMYQNLLDEIYAPPK